MWSEWRSRQPLLSGAAVAHVAVLAVCLCLALIDGTQITGLNRWIKPAKFAASIGIFLGTMAWLWPVAVAAETAKRRAARVLAGTLALEMVLIFLQAARGEASHFNRSTGLNEAIFATMGIAIVINIAATAVVLRWTFRASPDAYVWGVRLGLLLFVVFASEGGMMVRLDAHTVGAPDGGPGLPFVNWSTAAGDLRVAHFTGMHALQALPMLGSLTKSTRAVAAGFGAWAALAGWTLWMALRGTPLVGG